VDRKEYLQKEETRGKGSSMPDPGGLWRVSTTPSTLVGKPVAGVPPDEPPCLTGVLKWFWWSKPVLTGNFPEGCCPLRCCCHCPARGTKLCIFQRVCSLYVSGCLYGRRSGVFSGRLRNKTSSWGVGEQRGPQTGQRAGPRSE